jgi:hypothetical protein
MQFILGVILFVGVAGYLDSRVRWNKNTNKGMDQ